MVIAPTAFKGTLSPGQAAEAIAAGIARRNPRAELTLAPIADGGDGFLEVLTAAASAERRSVVVRGPVHSPVAAGYGLRDDGVAIIESALAIGLSRMGSSPLDPMGASSGGLGELLAAARHAGARRFMVGLGGSAGTDGGTGMARALGYRFLDAAGHQLPEGGGALRRLARIDASGFDPGWLMLDIVAGCDVRNPLLGAAGAAAVYAPQKGASPSHVEVLEEGLGRLVDAIRADLGIDVGVIPHGGAAGGLGAGLRAFLGARLVAGAELVLGQVDLAMRLHDAHLLVTGEGRLDGQSGSGKAPVAAGRLARRLGVRSVALVGSVGEGWETARDQAFDAVVVVPAPPPGENMNETTAGQGPRDARDRLAAAAALIDL